MTQQTEASYAQLIQKFKKTVCIRFFQCLGPKRTDSRAFAFTASTASPTSCAYKGTRIHFVQDINMSEPYVHFQIKTNTAVMLIGNTQQQIFVFVSNSLGRVACHPRHPRPPVHASHRISTPMTNRQKSVTHN